MPRAGLSGDAVVAAASRLSDAGGVGELTLARVARELGVRTPSLYNHVGGLADLRARMALAGVRELADALRRAVAGRARDDALFALARAYRDFARRRPGVYAATLAAPPAGDSELAAAADDAVDTLLAVLAGYGLEGDRAIHAARAVRSALHGFVSLEQAGGFGIPLDADESYERLVALVARGLGES